MVPTPHRPIVELQSLIAAAKAASADDSAAMNQIIRRFEKLAFKIAARLTDDHFLREDLANAALHALVRAVRNHDGRPHGFATFAVKYMHGAALREQRRLTATNHAELAFTDSHEVATHGHAGQFETAVVERLVPWGDGPVGLAVIHLTPAQQRLLGMRYQLDMPLADIADGAGTSVSAVSQRLSTIHRQLARAA
jgi:DNA-directed RNA polymerase specialized sigma subunit